MMLLIPGIVDLLPNRARDFGALSGLTNYKAQWFVVDRI